MRKIDKIETTLYRLPLPEAVGAASTGVMSELDMVMVRLWDTDGTEGCGYTPLFINQGAALVEIINNVCSEIVRQEDPSRIEWIWHRMWRQLHYAGRGGPVSLAIAAVDTALWDLKGKSLKEPLWRLLGGFKPEVKAYAGNIDLNFPVDKLLAGA
ncbi:uncharacterized protein METZ01_LOCUS293907, partial [marine metagenome]